MAKILSLSWLILTRLWAKKFLVGVLILGALILILQFFIYRGEEEVFRKILLISGFIELFNLLVGLFFYLIKEEILAYFFWIVALAIAIVSLYYVKFVVFSLV